MTPSHFASGFAMIIGQPNAGKSTLLNALLDFKLSIVTPKPQTTRKKITGIYNSERCQIIFLDTPGILKPRQKLHESMLGVVRSTVTDADVLIALLPYTGTAELFDRSFAAELFTEWILPSGKPVVAVLNKSDLASQEEQKAAEAFVWEQWKPTNVLSVSALKRKNLTPLISALYPFLPLTEPLYPDEALSTAPERFFVSELIREKIFMLYGAEIPYSTEVVVDEFREQHDDDPSRKEFIRCSIVVERDTQKQIIIGKGGAALKKLGQLARKAIEEMLGRPVYLELFVKVRPDWRKKSGMLKSFGY
uniref:GTPase Era n=1 Tax=Chlorobium chlorochromatii (strain CaD3) TaxID=340177 RepID=Q3AT33_CHLCH